MYMIEDYLETTKKAIELLTENNTYIPPNTEHIYIRLAGSTIKNIEITTTSVQIIHFHKDKRTDTLIYIELLPSLLVTIIQLYNDTNTIQLDEIDTLLVLTWIEENRAKWI